MTNEELKAIESNIGSTAWAARHGTPDYFTSENARALVAEVRRLTAERDLARTDLKTVMDGAIDGARANRDEVDALRAQLAAAQATNVAMREALAVADGSHRHADDCPRSVGPKVLMPFSVCSDCGANMETMETVRAALAAPADSRALDAHCAAIKQRLIESQAREGALRDGLRTALRIHEGRHVPECEANGPAYACTCWSHARPSMESALGPFDTTALDAMLAKEYSRGAEESHRAQAAMVIGAVGGMVNGAPTHSGNYLQRVRAFVREYDEALQLAQAEQSRALGLHGDLAAMTELLAAERAKTARCEEMKTAWEGTAKKIDAALTAAQARVAELKVALKKHACGECHHLVNPEGRECRAEDKHGWRFCDCVLDHYEPALARVDDLGALREFGLKVAARRRLNLRSEPFLTDGEVVDAVLAGRAHV